MGLPCGSQSFWPTRLKIVTVVSVIRQPRPRPHLRGVSRLPSPKTRAQTQPSPTLTAHAPSPRRRLSEAGAPGLAGFAASSTALAPTPFFPPPPHPAALPAGGPRPEIEGTSSGNQLRCACAGPHGTPLWVRAPLRRPPRGPLTPA